MFTSVLPRCSKTGGASWPVLPNRNTMIDCSVMKMPSDASSLARGGERRIGLQTAYSVTTPISTLTASATATAGPTAHGPPKDNHEKNR
jgi:hypothetical protein